MSANSPLLLRQVAPAWIQGGRISSQTFLPTPKDDAKLSVYDGNMIDAAGSYEHYTSTLKLNSAGVVAVSGTEVESQSLTWRPDPVPFPEHAIIDFSALPSKNQIRAKAGLLADVARSRGWLHRP